MSLINDALRRARDADRKRDPARPELPLKPIDDIRGPKSRSHLPIVVVVIAALALSLWSFSKWAGTTPPTQPQLVDNPVSPAPLDAAPQTPIPSNSPSLSANPSAASPAQIQPAPVVRVDPVRDSSPSPAAISETPIQSPAGVDPIVSAPPTSSNAPAFRLQSIIYRPRHPVVIINGQLLGRGDTIADARIIDIQPEQVTLKTANSNIVLAFPKF